jgi:hypothetical protein
MYHRVTGNIVKWTHAQHLRYGATVRVAPNELSFIDPLAWKEMYGFGKGDFPKDLRLLGPDFFVKPGDPLVSCARAHLSTQASGD